MPHVPRGAIPALAVIALSGCSFSPINHRIKVGEEPFIVFVGEGVDHNTDLFAVPAGGGAVAQITFTALVERGPRLSPTGEVVAFVRMRDTLPDAQREIVLMNLQGGGEVLVKLPADAGVPDAVAWAPDAHALYVRTDRGSWRLAVPSASAQAVAVPAADTAAADSAFEFWIGEPRFARVVACAGGGLCTVNLGQDTSALAPQGHDPIRWGSDSIGWFQQNGIMVRALGPGRERRVTWTNGPEHPRDGSYAPGPASAPESR